MPWRFTPWDARWGSNDPSCWTGLRHLPASNGGKKLEGRGAECWLSTTSRTSRRNIYEREFAQALAIADQVMVAGLFQPEKIPEQDRLSVAKVIEDINGSTRDSRARVIDKAEDIAEYVASNAASGDIVLVMSNGGFDGVQEKILRSLESTMPETGA